METQVTSKAAQLGTLWRQLHTKLDPTETQHGEHHLQKRGKYFTPSDHHHAISKHSVLYRSHCKTHSISQHYSIWSKIFCETDAQLTLQLISFHLAPVVGSSFLIHISTCLLHPVEFISNKVEMQLPSDISKKATWYMPYLMTFFLAYVSGIFLTFFLAFYLVYLRRFFVVEVQRGTLWSGARGCGPAGNALIQRLLLGFGGEHYDLQSVPEL